MSGSDDANPPDEWDPGEHTVAEVVEYLDGLGDDETDERDRVLAAEAEGKARKGVLERAEPEGVGPLGATTVLREDFMGRDLVDPTGTATDYMGRATTATADYNGQPLRRTIRSMALAVTLGQEIQYADGAKLVVKTAGTTHATVAPASPAVGEDVTDGTAVLTRQR